MPIVNGKYESPIWENNQPPAMDAAEMQAITDSVEESIHALGDYTTPAQKMGLTGDLSVGASLGVLADIGNVHVWRKTVVAEEEVPAGYELGNAIQITLVQNPYGSGHSNAEYYISSNVTVSEYGEISLVSPETIEIWNGPDYISTAEPILGKFIKFTGTLNGNEVSSGISSDDVYFIPVDAEIITNTEDRPSYTNVSGAKRVSGYPATPPGTHVTYLTSVNRDAYQEGDDAKEAGYMLGEAVEGKTPISMTYDGCGVVIGSTIHVEENGAISFAPDSGATQYWSSNVDVSLMKGKFFHTVGGEGDSDKIGNFSDPNYWVYLPEDAVITRESLVGSGTAIFTTKYQPVTGYPAIPAGTTIEYLGVLGDKIRMQIVSYIGTGTSGEATPCSITADFKFKTAEYLGSLRGGSLSPAVTYIDARDKVLSEAITTEFTAYSGFCLDDSQDSFGKKSEDGKTITWYSRYNNRQSNQLNEAGVKYYFRFFG